MIGKVMYNILYVLVYPFFKLFFRCKYVNRNNLPKTGRFILCSNHVHNLDPVLIALGQRRAFVTMAKSELFKNKLIGGFLRYMGAFPVERGKGDTGAIGYAEQALRDGHAMLIFFEGTRSKTGELLRPKTGVSMIAYQTQTPIIPICITPKGQVVKLFHRNMITFGDPIMPEEFGIEKGTGMEFRSLSRKIMGIITEMREHDKKVMLGDKYVPPVKEEAKSAAKAKKEADEKQIGTEEKPADTARTENTDGENAVAEAAVEASAGNVEAKADKSVDEAAGEKENADSDVIESSAE